MIEVFPDFSNQVCCSSEVIWIGPVNMHYHPGPRRSLCVVLVLLAAAPAALGGAENALSGIFPPRMAGQNVAATAAGLGNQLPLLALARGVDVVPDGSSGGELVLCAGAASVRLSVRLNTQLECTNGPHPSPLLRRRLTNESL